MKNWNIIATFTYPHEAHIAKGKLESEGFEVEIRDELTAQVNNFYSNAIGGVKLLVKENETEKAIKVLKEAGFIKEEKSYHNNFLSKIEKVTSKIPILNKTYFEFRIVIILTLIISICILPLLFLSLPSTTEKLTEHDWCVDKFEFQGKQYQPYTTSLKVIYNNGCSETIYFQDNGSVVLPGFNSKSINANWKFENKRLVIYNSDTLSHVFNGEYKINLNHNSIKLESKNTIILGHPNIFQW